MVLFSVTTLYAAKYWNSDTAVSDDWTVAANWNSEGVPTITDLVYIKTLSSMDNPVVYDTAETNECKALYLGDSAGYLRVSNGKLNIDYNTGNYSIVIGSTGLGYLEHTGGYIVGRRYLIIGDSEGASGEYLMSGNAVNLQRYYSMRIGNNGTGKMVLTNSASYELAVDGHVYLGYGATGNGTLILTDQAEFKTTSPASIVIGKDGKGTLICKGVGISQNSHPSADLIVRDTIDATGCLRGYGEFGGAGTIINNGLIIADGYGEDNDLSLMNYGSYSGVETTTSTIENDSTNGFYAVNHGRLKLRQAYLVSGSNTVTFGESADDQVLDMVNSMRVTLLGVDYSNRYLDWQLMAADRTDVAVSPEENLSFIGVWNININGDFDSMSFQLRYDHEAADNRPVSLYHYDTASSEWEEVGGAEQLSGYRFSATGLEELGMYAVVVDTSLRGTVICIE
jgi:hypothetical protein